jgi:ribonuclease HI
VHAPVPPGYGRQMRTPQGPRRPRRAGRANSDAERRALAKANAAPDDHASPPPPRAGFAVLHADGGARGNPGPAGIGYVIHGADGTQRAEHAEPIGVAGANVAEYRALLAGLRRAHALGLDHVDARCDSRLVVAHVRGERQARNPKLAALGDEIREAAAAIGSVTFTWIPGDANGAAHALVARVLST